MAEATKVPVKAQSEGVSRWEPMRLFDDLRDDMMRLWGDAFPFRPFLAPRPLQRLTMEPTVWAPQMDVFEKNGTLVVKAELPGIRKEDVEVTIEDGLLVIRGERRQESEIKEDDYYRMERCFGSFYRTVPLPAEVQADQIKAKFEDGVLEIQVPKPVEPKPRAQKIAIS